MGDMKTPSVQKRVLNVLGTCAEQDAYYDGLRPKKSCQKSLKKKKIIKIHHFRPFELNIKTASDIPRFKLLFKIVLCD